MNIVFKNRLSESPYIEQIWHGYSERASTFVSIAASHWELVVWKQYGETHLTLRGPETQATSSPVLEDSESFGILFKLGTFMPHLPVNKLVNQEIMLPGASRGSFWLHGATWQLPTYDNAEIFVDRLVREGLLVRESNVSAALKGHPQTQSLRTVQRQFLRATGLSHNAIYQIERARHATILLQQGASILDTVYEAGYFDQPHLTRSLKRLIGQTPTQVAQIIDESHTEAMSFLYNTDIWR